MSLPTKWPEQSSLCDRPLPKTRRSVPVETTPVIRRLQQEGYYAVADSSRVFQSLALGPGVWTDQFPVWFCPTVRRSRKNNFIERRKRVQRGVKTEACVFAQQLQSLVLAGVFDRVSFV